jgi:hypothetical protein
MQFMLDQGIETTATVVWLEEDTHSDHRTYFPVLRFRTQEQETITACYYHSKPQHGYKVGEQMQVHYDPSDPTKFLVPSFAGTEMWIYKTLGFGAGLLSLLTRLPSTRTTQIWRPLSHVDT